MSFELGVLLNDPSLHGHSNDLARNAAWLAARRPGIEEAIKQLAAASNEMRHPSPDAAWACRTGRQILSISLHTQEAAQHAHSDEGEPGLVPTEDDHTCQPL